MDIRYAPHPLPHLVPVAPGGPPAAAYSLLVTGCARNRSDPTTPKPPSVQLPALYTQPAMTPDGNQNGVPVPNVVRSDTLGPRDGWRLILGGAHAEARLYVFIEPADRDVRHWPCPFHRGGVNDGNHMIAVLAKH